MLHCTKRMLGIPTWRYSFSKKSAYWFQEIEIAYKGKQTKKRKMTMKLTRSFNTWRETRRTAFELNQLSERHLEDIGMNRGDIDAVALKSARAISN